MEIQALQEQFSQLNATVYQLEERLGRNHLMTSNLWKIQASIFVFFMQVGFSLVEAGTVRLKNTRSIMVKNVLDTCVCVIAFWIFGYAFGFGYGSKYIGWEFESGKEAFFGSRGQVDFFFQFSFAATCATIIAGAVAERTQLLAYLVYSFCLSSFIYPVIAHLIWSNSGLLSASSEHKVLGTHGVLDNAGSMVVHVTGGVTALVGSWMVGPRIGRFDIDGKPIPMKSHSMVFTAAGTLILWVGFFGFNTAPVDYNKDDGLAWTSELARVACNTALSAAFSGIAVFSTQQLIRKRSKPEDVFNSVLGGLVAACATSGVVRPYAAAIIGFVAGYVYLGGVWVLMKLQIDDVVMAAPVHLFCGTWGGLAVGFFAAPYEIRLTFGIDEPSAWGLFHGGGLAQLGTQVIGLLVVYIWVGVTTFIVFYALAYFNALRVDRQLEEGGLDLAFHGGSDRETDAWNGEHRRPFSVIKDRKIFSVSKLRSRCSMISLSGQRRGERSLRSSMWYKPLKSTAYGEFSFAMYEANYFMEDAGEVEATSSGVYIGVHDGHGGAEAATFLKERLYQTMKDRFLKQNGVVTVDAIRDAFLDTEEAFVNIVRDAFPKSPHLATVGSCSLVAIVSGDTLYVANVGDARAVLGATRGIEVTAIQLSVDHNVNDTECREAYMKEHELCCGGDNLVWERNGKWRVKGRLQLTKSFGDLCMKYAEFNREPLFSRFRIPEPFKPPIISVDPSVNVHQLTINDEFLILASDGLWEYLTNEEAVEIVNTSPRKDIARVLIKSALQIAARTREVPYNDLVHMPSGQRREYHDDMTVIVFFFKHGSRRHDGENGWKHSMSVKGGQAAKIALNAISAHMHKASGHHGRSRPLSSPPHETVIIDL
ncbi:pyruvate dehydrogenase phosphatase [Marchantia polymorpha subsp. ruderalis]|uniref:PPM-type phosphatase domain-containing protein n=2 Tax=Marchantia polymorpha TaxID=3197 RepID=A0A176W981_MARPO|nr:hypothetical protein AXG93_1617s1100 [Marchantia polymorpha subsp. ruderalis]PTQ27437.1 hypothetical protein MARPO_0198s0006 [Marchantia polymorpha]BBN10952.1 hypothetical protein Mp_5g07870 [Marchantia polymorpha subsp. ruderalis]|eukprot:PTQ27437.1 hypothetical protein MARPO_0198s0006 [Marchantia polymorpha]